MKPIELPIFHHTDQTSVFKDTGIDYSFEDLDVRPVTFFHINAISPFIDQDKQYSAIHSNGSEYICSIPYKELIKKVLK